MRTNVSIDHLYICAGSAGLFGALGYDGGPPIQEQRCRYVDCPYREERWHRPKTELPEPFGDFPEAIELCHCCASAVIPSGSKFSSFFCDDCRAAVMRLTSALGTAAIPLGRHSLMNGVTLAGGAAARDPLRVKSFALAVQHSFNRIDRLWSWQRTVVADHIAAMQLDARCVPASAYLAFTASDALPKRELFRQLCRYFGIEVDE